MYSGSGISRSVNWGSAGFQPWMNVRYASTQAGAALHFVEGDSGDTLQASSGVDPVLVSDQVGSAGSGLGEVAAAAADCSVPTAALQHLIDFVHTQGGLPW